MKVILLAAGYSKRLGELTANTPKALLTLNEKPMLNYLIEKLEKIEQLKDVFLVTNNKYYQNFIDWQNTYKGRLKIQILNDLTNNNDERLGAIGDIMLTLDHYKIDDDILVSATDGYFDFEITDMIEYFYTTNKNVVMGKKYDNLEELKRLGVASIDKNNKITLMEEKPQEPKSDIAIFATYLYKKEILPLFKQYKDEKNNMDAPGNFLSWLYKLTDVLAYVYSDDIFDIGTPESYFCVDNIVKEKHNK